MCVKIKMVEVILVDGTVERMSLSLFKGYCIVKKGKILSFRHYEE